jgi:hypothetical protein
MIDGTYLLIVIIALAILYGVFRLAAWEEFDDRRRRERLVHRNLQRSCGR